MPPWLRITLLAVTLFAVLAGSAAISLAPTIPDIGTPPISKLLRRGTAEPGLSAEAVLIERLKSSETLWERNTDLRLPIASLTKLMTALLLAEVGQPLDAVEFSAEAKRIGGRDDKRSAAIIGERLRAEDMLRMLLISSDNDAAYAAAEYVALLHHPELANASFPDRTAAFVTLMNARAEALGLTHTHFANPAGSDDPANYSSARDLAALAKAIAKTYPELWAISRTHETFIFGEGGRRYGLVNTNPLLREYPAIYGSKTGYEDEAKGALLILYQLARDELFLIVLLRSADRFGPNGDGRAAIQWLEENFVIESR
ncbi:MAG: hypothetical protein Q8R35_02350 [bacterium]|nr:hypothetical protein [bacterium]